jgi:hypothetical protein
MKLEWGGEQWRRFSSERSSKLRKLCAPIKLEQECDEERDADVDRAEELGPELGGVECGALCDDF